MAETNLYIDQGITYAFSWIVTDTNRAPIDVTGATVRSQVRKSYTSTTAYPFTAIVTDGPNGVIELSMTADQTAAMKPGRYVYDAEYQIDTFVVRFLRGIVTVYPRVTQ